MNVLKTLLKAFAIGFAVLVAFSLPFTIMDAYREKQIKDELGTTDITGYVVTRDVVVKYCKEGANSVQDSGFTDSQINAYCNCMYDRGTSELGGAELTRQLTELGNTNTVPAGLNNVINYCLTTI